MMDVESIRDPGPHPVEDRPPPSDPVSLSRRIRRHSILLTVATASLILLVRLLAVPVAAEPATVHQFTLQFQTPDDGTADDRSTSALADTGDTDVPQEPVDAPTGADDPKPEGPVVARVEPSSRGGARSPESLQSAAPAPDVIVPFGDRIVSIAMKYEGYPYRWGGQSPQYGFDCSGFTWYVYREAGLNIPNHDLWGQLNAGPKVDRDQLRPGDLVFFKNTYIPGLSHSGIYVGNDRFISAVDGTFGVFVVSMSSAFWAPRFYGASRPW